MESLSEQSKSSTERLDDLLRKAELFQRFLANNMNNNTENGNSGESNDADEKDRDTISFPVFSETPKYMETELRDYQIHGLNWLISLYESEMNGILADEMGLGKTIQAISIFGYVKYMRNISGPFLVVAPKSTLTNWSNEIKKFCPKLNAIVMTGNADERKQIIKNSIKNQTDWDVIITSYEGVILEKPTLQKIHWHFILVDEAHRLKNEETILSRFLRKFQSKHRLLLTGTPLQNNLHELWALLNFLMPNLFDSSSDFDEWFDVNKCLEEDQNVVQRLQMILKPFLLRRVKSEVEKSLLPKKEYKIMVGLSKMQREWYKKILLSQIEYINPKGEFRKLMLKNLLMQLRKVINHPYIFPDAEPGPPYQDGEHMVTNCGKMIILDKLLAKMKTQGSKVLIFSQFKIVLDIIGDYLDLRKYNFCRIDGSTTLNSRYEQMDDFNSSESDKFVFLLTTRAGGLGINLTGADVVIIYDSDWNPQCDLQAIDRAHRIGQKKQVRVFRLVTENTVDEKLVERAEAKRHLDRVVIQQGHLTQATSETMSKGDTLGIINHGMQYVLSSNESDIKDEDIDVILSRAESRTAEENEKFAKMSENQLKNFNFNQNISVFEFEGINFRKTQKKRLELFSLKQRTCNLNGRFKRFENELQTDLRLRRLESEDVPKQKYRYFQFLHPMLTNLLEVEATGMLNPDGIEWKEYLLPDALINWTEVDYKHYILALQMYGRNDLQNISQSVPGKTQLEVLKYHKVFEEKGPSQVPDYELIMLQVKRTEESIKNKRPLSDITPENMGNHNAIDGARNYENVDDCLISFILKFGLRNDLLYELIKMEIDRDIRLLSHIEWFQTHHTTAEIKEKCFDAIEYVLTKHIYRK